MWKTSNKRQYEWLYHECTRLGSIVVLKNYPSELYAAQGPLKNSQISSSDTMLQYIQRLLVVWLFSFSFSMKQQKKHIQKYLKARETPRVFEKKN